MPGKLQRALFEIAEDNYGYVTVAQAAEVGVSRRGLADLARLGSLRREAHGLYRIVDFPATPYDTYAAATLWPRGTRGVLSHETALDLWDLCDVNPAKVHITIPRHHRTRRQVPALYVLHNAVLDAGDVDSFEGIPTTTVARTLLDCINHGTRSDLLEQAITTADSRGEVTAGLAASLRANLASRSARS